MSKCPFCGHDNPAGMELCKGCGAKIPDAAVQPAPPMQTSAPDADQPDSPPDDLEGRVLEEMRQGRKISAIKLHREATGMGLKESKEAVEALAAQHGIVARGGGCAGAVLLMLVALTVVVVIS